MSTPFLWAYPFTLSTSATSGRFVVRLPVSARNVVVLNTSSATLAYAAGEIDAQPPDAITVPNNFNLGLPIEETQYVTVWWAANAAPAVGDNTGVMLFSNEPVIMAAPNSAGGVASSVDVVNTITANINQLPGVTVTSQPLMAGSTYAGGSAQVKVDASGNQYVVVDGTPAVVVSNNTLLEVGVSSTSQTSVSTTAVQLAIPTGQKSIAVKNMDSSNTVYLGSASTVTTTTGFPLGPQQTFEFDTDPSSAGPYIAWAIAGAALDVAVMGVK